MAVHKYVFFMTEKGIKTYRVRENSDYKLIKFKGEILYKGNMDEDNIGGFFKWFLKVASIAQDDMIDFCFLSEKPVEVFPYLEGLQGNISSWDKKEVINFCEKEIGNTNYEIVVDENNRFFSQISNIYNDTYIKKIYLKCFPDFSAEAEEKANSEKAGSENTETSILCQYFIDALSKL